MCLTHPAEARSPPTGDGSPSLLLKVHLQEKNGTELSSVPPLFFDTHRAVCTRSICELAHMKERYFAPSWIKPLSKGVCDIVLSYDRGLK